MPLNFLPLLLIYGIYAALVLITKANVWERMIRVLFYFILIFDVFVLIGGVYFTTSSIIVF